MLWMRAIVFSVLVPGLVAVWLPLNILGPKPLQPGVWRGGWLLVAAGAAVYLRCLLSFVRAHGTPAIFFSRHLRMLIGEEPRSLVRGGLYRYSRNPMYVGVLAVLVGEAILYASTALAAYGLAVFGFFYLIVTRFEEPHLRRRDGESFEQYRREVPRWIGLPRWQRT